MDSILCNSCVLALVSGWIRLIQVLIGLGTDRALPHGAGARTWNCRRVPVGDKLRSSMVGVQAGGGQGSSASRISREIDLFEHGCLHGRIQQYTIGKYTWNRHSRGIYVSELGNIVGGMIESYGDRKTLNILSSYYNTVVRWTYMISPQVNNIVGCTPVQQAVPVFSRYSLVS